MSLNQYLKKISEIRKSLLIYVYSKDNIEEKYQDFINKFKESEFEIERNELKLFLRLLNKISKNYIRSSNFFDKILQILNYLKQKIQEYISQKEIFNIFKTNKRILLFFIEEKILQLDLDIINYFSKFKHANKKYLQYFFPEINSLLSENDKIRISHELNEYFDFDSETKTIINKNLEKFEQNRRTGENEEYICELVRNDSIEEFIIYVKKNDFVLNTTIKQSIFETNSFLMKKRFTLIEYASFFGSIQIFKYLYLNGVDLRPSLWYYSIHGFDPEMFQILEENNVQHDSYDLCLKESIKCHHDDITNYIQNNYINENNEEKTLIIFYNAIRYYNFTFIYEELIDQSSLNNFVTYDYYSLIKILLKNKDIDVNWMKKELHEEKTALYTAVKNKRIDIIKFLLSCPNINTNIGCKSKDNGEIKSELSPLYSAIEINDIEIVKLLLSSKITDINSVNTITTWRTKQIETALFYAIKLGNIEIVRVLLSHDKIDINFLNTLDTILGEKYVEKRTALFIACQKGNNDIVKLLLSFESIDINLGYKFSMTNDTKTVTLTERKSPLYVAIEYENVETVKILLSQPNINVNMDNDFSRDSDCIDKDALQSERKYPLYVAVEKGNIEIVKLLISHPDIDVNDKNKIRFTQNVKYVDVEEEIESRTRRTKTKKKTIKCFECKSSIKTALFKAVEDESIEIVRLLLSSCQNIEINYKNLLITCIFQENDKDKSNVEDVKQEDKSVLHLAIEKENIEIIKLLLEYQNIDVNLRDEFEKSKFDSYKSEKTPLYNAIEKENIEIIKLLLSSPNINVNLGNKLNGVNYSPLHLAIEKGNIEIIQLLISHEKINIDNGSYLFAIENDNECTTTESKTPLFIAVEKENIEVIKLLLSCEKIKFTNGYSLVKLKYENDKLRFIKCETKAPLFLAIEKENVEIVSVLISYEKTNVNFGYKSEEVINDEEILKINETPLYAAVDQENLEIIETLLQNEKVDINLCSTYMSKEDGMDQKRAPLHSAVESQNIKIIRALLNNDKIDVNIVDEQGKKPIEYTKSKRIINLFDT